VDEWLPIADAAVYLGISKTAMRRRVDRGSVEARKDDDGRWLVHVTDADTSDAPQGTSQGATRDTMDGTPEDTGGFTRDLVAVLREQLATKDQQIAEKDRQLAAREREISELHVLLQTSQQNEQRLLSATVPEATEPPVSAREMQDGKSGVVDEKSSQRVTGEASAPSAKRRGFLARLFGLG
jgi:hypothetical protein